jgi:hypothetical protein
LWLLLLAVNLEDLVKQARNASLNDRIDFRDAIASHGHAAVDAMAEWLADPQLTRFAVRVIGKTADLGTRDSAIATLQLARGEATAEQRADIDLELHRLGVSATGRAELRGGGEGDGADPSVPGWMMRTDRRVAGWLWSEVLAGRLRQGWGYSPAQDLRVLRDRRQRGERMDRDDDWAWPNRRMLSDEPDGMQIGDLVLLPHLPEEWRWSITRITGPYRYEIAEEHRDYGHILPVEVVAGHLSDSGVTDEIKQMRTYPARLRRLSRRAYDDLQRLIE